MKVKVETMHPYREVVAQFEVAKSDRLLSEVTVDVDKFVKEQLPTYLENHPTVYEFRWEYTDIGQGHYITKMKNGEWI